VIAFDTGPGNMVIDQLAWVITKGKQTFDRGGRLAKQGKPNRTLLAQLLRDPYYRGRPPKSCGREQFGREFVASLLATQLPLPDLIATASLLTPLTISDAVREYAPDELIASGGGTMNPVIMDHLRGLLPGVLVSTTDDHGLPAEAKEAVAFAILAYETWHRRWSNLPSATGARRAVILGSITHA
jgi:anhydro-N-acetylmuramic acid kinase